MRKILLFLATASLVMPFFSSCSKNNDDGASLTVEYDYSKKVSEKGGTATFSIKANIDWSVSNTDEWITSIEPKQGSGNQTVTVTFGPNNATSIRSSIFEITAVDFKEDVLIVQAAGNFPSAAGNISGDDEGSESITLTIAEIEGANTYKWYKDGVEVQNSAARTYTATASGTYTVAGVNSVGEGQSSSAKMISIIPLFEFDVLPEGTFAALGVPVANVGGTWSWSGTVTKKTEDTKKSLIISHWGGTQFNFNVPLLHKDGRLIVDNETLLVSDTTTTPGSKYDGYFMAFYVDANGDMHEIEGFSPKYNKDEMTISFSGTYNGYSVYIGVIALLNGEFYGVFSEIYKNARVVITPSSAKGSSAQYVTGINGGDFNSSRIKNLKGYKKGYKVQFDPTKFISE